MPNLQGQQIAYSPPQSVVAEMKVQTSTFDAGWGFNTGAVMNMVLKSGANAPSGSVSGAWASAAKMRTAADSETNNGPNLFIRQLFESERVKPAQFPRRKQSDFSSVKDRPPAWIQEWGGDVLVPHGSLN